MNKSTIVVHETIRGDILIVVNTKQLTEFKELIQRGANLWPDAPPAIKHFADVVTNGAPLQDYFDHASTQLKT